MPSPLSPRSGGESSQRFGDAPLPLRATGVRLHVRTYAGFGVSEHAVERKARNEAIFRDANEEIKAVRDDLTIVAGTTPFICECEDPRCRTVVRVALDDYETVREEPRRFLLARGHPTTCGTVVSDHGEYLVVEKYGVAGEVAEETDPRSVEHR